MAASPTTSVGRAVKAMVVALALGTVLGAHGIVHSAHGMQDGIERDATLAVGNAALWISETTHLDWPWIHLEESLGRSEQPDVPPLLLASGSGPQPVVPAPDKKRVHSQPGPKKAPKPVARPVPLRKPTAGRPLRLLVTGDSQTEFMGPDLVDSLSNSGVVDGSVDIHYGTGLARPDYVDWALVARQQMSSRHPEAIVVFMGGNDAQGMTLANGTVLSAGTPAWAREYARRAVVCMRIWAAGPGHRVYWLSVPPARDPGWAADNTLMNVALRQAASQVPGAEYINILGPITNHGQYSDSVLVNGVPTLVRTPDGFHLTGDGASIVAGEVARVLRSQWHIRG